MMNVNQAIELFEKSKKRCILIGNENAGVLAGLDLEGRLWAVKDGVILNRFNPEAVTGQCTQDEYLNPGGDGLWPAPEGSQLGYNYSTGKWRVPPGLTTARFRVIESTDNHAIIRAEVDLINSRGTGIATAFERDVRVTENQNSLQVTVTETIEYLGNKELSSEDCLLAAWSLCQFDSNKGCEVVFPATSQNCVWDLYEPSDNQRNIGGDLWHTKTEPSAGRYQIGIDKSVDWIELRNPQTGLNVRRTAEIIPDHQNYIDITDRESTEPPSPKGIRFSVYNDPSGFMEIEAAGGCPKIIKPGMKLSTTITTTYRQVRMTSNSFKPKSKT